MDCPSPKVVLLVLWVVIASALDAVLTPQRLAEGFREANPVMAIVVAYDTGVFIALKMAAASAGCWILAAHQQFVLAVTGLYGLAILYTGVLAIHGMLLVAGS